jgi:hypothetical protein
LFSVGLRGLYFESNSDVTPFAHHLFYQNERQQKLGSFLRDKVLSLIKAVRVSL